MAQYGRSKLAAILYLRYLARHLTSTHPNILVNATHPGIVEMRQQRARQRAVSFRWLCYVYGNGDLQEDSV